MYRGATAAGIPMIVANGTAVPIEKIAASANGPRWSQFYPNASLATSRERLERVQAAGARAIVVTIDNVAGTNERDQHFRHVWNVRGANAGGGSGRVAAPGTTKGPGLYGVETPGRLWYNWQYLDDIRPFIKGPMLIKGILTAEDARICVQRGYDGVIVSNHGGRAMDGCPATLEVLPEIVDEVGGKIAVLVDSGFRRGSDIVKALALGANAVCLGRAPRWALGAFGAPGVQRLLEILQAELREAMASTGCTTLAALTRTSVRTRFS